MTPADYLWIWLHVTVVLIGTLTIIYWMIHVALLAWDGYKATKVDTELKASAERAATSQAEREVTPMRTVGR